MLDEKALDQLYDLQQRRAAAIRANGTPFTFANSEKQVLAVLENDRQSLKTEAGAPVHLGAILEQKGISFYVLSAEERPGHRVCEVAEVRSFAQVHQKTAVRGPGGVTVQLTPMAQRIPILVNKGNEIVTARNHAHIKGMVLQLASGPVEVVGAIISGNLAHLKVEPYQAPVQKSYMRGPERPDYLDRAPVKAPWSSTDSYRGW